MALLLGLAASLAASDPTPRIQGRFDLRDARTGRSVTQASYPGRYRLVFFGFTHCPLTCPLGLRTLNKALAKLGKDAAQVQALFITIDPSRDSAKVMAAYLQGFDPRITGLVGSPTAIHAAMKDFRLEAEQIGQGDQALFEHPSIIYVMGRGGEYLRTLPSNGDPDKMAGELRRLIHR
jgi:protein SCO1/2